MAPQLVFAYGDRRVKAITDTTHLIESVKTVRLMVEDRLGLSADTYDLFDTCGKIEQLKDLQRAIHMAGEQGECTIEVREHALATRLRAVEAENSQLTIRISHLEEELRSSLARVERRFAEETIPRIAELAQEGAEARRELGEVKRTLNGFNPQEFIASHDSFTEEVRRRLDEVDSQWQTDKLALTLVVDEAVKHCQQDMKGLEDYVHEHIGKIDTCVATSEQLRRVQGTSQERMQSMAADLRWQQDEHLKFVRHCASAFEEGLKRAEAHSRASSAPDQSAKVEN
mmetsp:Transcript_94259/g.236590  ORF Transcript_94259/g.236590 Transcript_94259/m.236590 type:complete len:285 (+) Transcript_94259:130-984(+)